MLEPGLCAASVITFISYQFLHSCLKKNKEKRNFKMKKIENKMWPQCCNKKCQTSICFRSINSVFLDKEKKLHSP